MGQLHDSLALLAFADGPRLPRHLVRKRSHIPHNVHKGEQKLNQEPRNTTWMVPTSIMSCWHVDFHGSFSEILLAQVERETARQLELFALTLSFY